VEPPVDKAVMMPVFLTTPYKIRRVKRDSQSAQKLWVYSGCQDGQTAADAHINNTYQGAFTWGFLEALSRNKWNTNYEHLLYQVRQLVARFNMLPALETTSEYYLEWFYLGDTVDPQSGVDVNDTDNTTTDSEYCSFCM